MASVGIFCGTAGGTSMVVAEALAEAFDVEEIVNMVANKVQGTEIRLRYDEHVEEELTKLENLISKSELSKKYSPRWLAIKLLEEDDEIIRKFKE